MRVAVALQTCDRVDDTARTLASFAQHNDLDRFVLLHGDDASEDFFATFSIAASYGFQSVVTNVQRQGIAATRLALVDAAAKAKAEWVLLLENDIESVRPFPWELFAYAAKHRQIYTMRLFGPYKDAEKTQPCKTTHQWRGNQAVTWRPFRNAPEKSQVGQIHWTAQPSITRTKALRAILRGDRPDALTVRVKKNVMSHFGERTVGRIL